MGRVTGRDTVTIYLTRPEHIQLATIKTKLNLTQTETVLLGLQILESLQPWEVAKHLNDQGRPKRTLENGSEPG